MKIIQPDHTRRIPIDGVPEPVRRPVDIDQSITGFKDLRTLRIYRFDPGSVIDGHAEEDEVFIVVLAGSIEITMSGNGAKVGPTLLEAPQAGTPGNCAAYLPPGGAYQLVAKSEADIAYARATPVGSHGPKIFSSLPGPDSFLEEPSYAEKLQLRLLLIGSPQDSVVVMGGVEALIHLKSEGETGVYASVAGAPEFVLRPWETVALSITEQCSLRASSKGPSLALIFTAHP